MMRKEVEIFGDKKLSEDLLEMIYIAWKDERRVAFLEVCKRFQLTEAETESVINELCKSGYLMEMENDLLELTELGKDRGAKCLEKSDFQSEFSSGWYAFTMCIYQLETCYLKILAEEFFSFEDRIWFEVLEDGACIE